MDKEKHYVIYQVTNLLNGKIYIGKHETFDINDDYMGSGKLVKRAIKKYGVENFKKEILFDFETEEEMNLKEKEIVNEEFLSRDDVYNLTRGGYGSFNYINKSCLQGGKAKYNGKLFVNVSGLNRKGREVFRKLILTDSEFKSFFSKQVSHGLIKKIKKDGFWWEGKHHTRETKLKMSLSKSGKGKGSENSNYGKHWWKDPNDKSKSMPIGEGDPVPEGWVRGRWQGGRSI